jgi:hypothetical protein
MIIGSPRKRAPTEKKESHWRYSPVSVADDVSGRRPRPGIGINENNDGAAIRHHGEQHRIKQKGSEKKVGRKHQVRDIVILLTAFFWSSAILCLMFLWIREIRYRTLTNANLTQAKALGLEPITNTTDLEHFTIRINTWKRNEQLLVSVNHHASCPGVAQIQLVWCDADEEPPQELHNHPSGKVVIERHELNSLNERFNPLMRPATIGVFSLDDDMLWPCEALDSGEPFLITLYPVGSCALLISLNIVSSLVTSSSTYHAKHFFDGRGFLTGWWDMIHGCMCLMITLMNGR